MLVAAIAGCDGATGETVPRLLGEPSVDYPPALFTQGVEGSVELRLFVDSAGAVVPESVSIHASSGYPAMDSAAVRAAATLKYAPGLRHGTPVAMPFVQPIRFHHPGPVDSSR